MTLIRRDRGIAVIAEIGKANPTTDERGFTRIKERQNLPRRRGDAERNKIG
jgi:hypothetical protein